MLPLQSKTVLITRPANQTADFINQLRSLGAKTVNFPLIKNEAINQKMLSSTFSASNFDWIIFTSVNAVRFFFETISSKQVNAKIAVVGPKTEQALKTLNIASDFTPSQYNAKTLAQELTVLKNDRILIPRSNLSKNDILKILASRHCTVKPIPIYCNTPISYSSTEVAAIFKQKIDFITFTSGSIVSYFVELGITLKDEKIVCIGPETAKVARKLKFKVTAIAIPHTVDSMVKCIVNSNQELP